MSTLLVPRIDAATRREFLGVLAATGLLVGCGEDAAPSPEVATRMFTHAFGTTEIPVNPQRIVTTSDQNGLLPLMELGLEPVGSAGLIDEERGTRSFRRTQDYDTSAVTHIGAPGNPNFESVVALKPDLIVGATGDDEIVGTLSEIAPFVAIDMLDGKRIEGLLQFGDLADRKDRALAFETMYRERIRTLREQIRERRPGMTVSMLRVLDEATFEIKDNVIAPVYTDLGLTPPRSQQGFDRFAFDVEPISVELLAEHDADVILLIDYQGESSELPTDQVLQLPLWQRLEAGRRGQVREFDGTQAVGTAWGKLFNALDMLERELLRDDLVFTGVNG